jgi:hypothetical protein
VGGIITESEPEPHFGSFTIYHKNRSQGAQAANEQVALLEAQKQRLTEEAQYLELRRRYVDIKIAYWKAVKSGDTEARLETMELTEVRGGCACTLR